MTDAGANVPGNTTAVIFAGGQATRMHGRKALRAFGGTTLLDRALAKAHGWTKDVAITARSADQLGATAAPVLLDAPNIEGPLAGLLSASRVPSPYVLTIPCDMPFLPDDLLDRLAGAIAGHDAVLASSGGQVQPVCGLWRTRALAGIAAYASSGRRSLIGFAESIGFTTVEWGEGPFANLNTPDEFEAARRLLG